jgi:nicotinate phosphoribosyltransferase
VKEGELVFPNEPVVRVEGNIIETQLAETLLLNLLNFESLIATKASRIRQAAGDRTLIDFGFRRAHGPGGVQASKAAISGGIDSTSNVLSAFRYGLESSGTMAHSWVQSFEDEITAFRAFAEIYPDHCILLVDTFDTLNSGLPNAVEIGLELRRKGHELLGIRLDSGDLGHLSKKSREMLDRAGLTEVRIIASNQLDEYVIQDLLRESAPIDAFGVGTSLITGQDTGALDGIYKLCSINGKPTLKKSENPAKVTLPGIKKLIRFFSGEGYFLADGIALEEETEVTDFYDPGNPGSSIYLDGYHAETLLEKVMDQGSLAGGMSPPEKVAAYSRERMRALPAELKYLTEPHNYRTGISRKLLNLKTELLEN